MRRMRTIPLQFSLPSDCTEASKNLSRPASGHFLEPQAIDSSDQAVVPKFQLAPSRRCTSLPLPGQLASHCRLGRQKPTPGTKMFGSHSF